MTRAMLSSVAVTAMMSLTAQPVPAQGTIGDQPSFSYQSIDFGYQKKDKVYKSAPKKAKKAQQQKFNLQNIPLIGSASASARQSKKRRLQAR